jgi:hypothetical protein
MLLDQISIITWLQNNQIKTETGSELDFKNHRYLFDIYRDNSKYLCCLKAGQIGFSTMAILKSIWLADNRGIDIGYILPTVDMVQKFVGSKVNRMAQQNPIIEKLMKDKDSITQKQIGNNYIHYLGAMTERAAIMISLDMLVADEYDKAPQNILEIYDSRLQHSKFGYKWVFSNPTRPDFGVDKFWMLSDQKKWHITHNCGKTYVMDESCIDYVNKLYICPHCHSEITDEERRMGEWIATSKGEWSGYWIPLWINPSVKAEKIAEYKATKTKEYFYNFVAGLPYVNPNDMLSLPILESSLSKEVNKQEGRIIIGLDTGHNLHYVLMNKQGIFFHGYCESVEESGQKEGYDPYDKIEKLLKTYPNSILVSDQGGDLIGIRKLQAKYKGRVFLCWFTKETRTKELRRWGKGEEAGRVLADRNRIIQLLVDQFNEHQITLNGTKDDWKPYFEHWLNMYRVKEIIDENEPLYGWRWVWKRKGPDHWALATVYAYIGMDKYYEDSAKIINSDPLDQIGGDLFREGDRRGARIVDIGDMAF